MRFFFLIKFMKYGISELPFDPFYGLFPKTGKGYHGMNININYCSGNNW